MVPIKYNVRSLMVRKRTTAAALFGLALVVWVFASALMLSAGLEKTFGRNSTPNDVVVLRKGSDTELTSGIQDKHANMVIAQAQQIGSTKQPAGVGEVVVVILLDKVGTGGVSNVTVRGVTDDALKFRPTVKIVEGQAPKAGSDEVLVGKAIRGRFAGLEMGKTFELKKNRPMKVVGVFEDGGSSYESEVWADIHNVRQAFGRDGYVSGVHLRLDDPSKFLTFKGLVEGDKQLGLVAMTEAEFVEKQSNQTKMVLTGIGLMVAFFFSIGAIIGAMITMNAQVAGRTREIGTLRALGFSRFSILFSFLVESATLAFFGGIIGAIFALGMQFFSLTMINMGTWSEIVFRFEPTPGIVIASLVVSIVMGLAGGFVPAVKAARISPIEAMRG